jgi:hypothetical protein
VNNIKTDLREMGWSVMDWIDLAQWRIIVNIAINLHDLPWEHVRTETKGYTGSLQC